MRTERRGIMTAGNGYEFWIDRGGTFTDVVARAPDGTLTTAKLLSSAPAQYADAAVEGIRRVLASAPPGARRIGAVKMGTTVATNALLERHGEPTALVVTAGLRDVVRIGSQQRPDLFALAIELPEMLYTRVVEAHERIAADGTVLAPLDVERLRADLAAVHAEGIRSVAIALLHGYRHPLHERLAADAARAVGFTQVSVSHRVSPLMKLVPRADTTLADAYLSPVLRRYVDAVRGGLREYLGTAPLLFMQSHGGLADAAAFQGKDSLLSGPAGGVVGMVAVARAAGFSHVIGFDMGGTSTDVSLYDGTLARTNDAVMAGVRVSAPMLEIETVAAGGGSIVTYANGRLQVGPESAGADPGPACYRLGGPSTVTDANVFLGRIQPDFFPHVFGADADLPIDVAASAAGFAALAERVSADAPGTTAEQVAAGCLRIAVERMANAIKRISVQRGHDTTRYALVSFGGAGGQHACQVADALAIGTVLVHPLAGVLSAYGCGVADLRELRRRTVEAALDEHGLGAAGAALAALEREARAALREQGVAESDIAVERRLHVKQAGSDTALAVAAETLEAQALRAAFDAAHERLFGFAASGAALVVDSAEIEAVGRAAGAVAPSTAAAAASAAPRANASQPLASSTSSPAAGSRRRVWFDGGFRDAPVVERERLAVGDLVDGPAVVVEAHATTIVEPGWRASVDASGCLVLTRVRPRTVREAADTAADPVMLEIFNHLFMHVAEEMGVVLESTAHSVNIKERLDFSCALFDPDGDLIANAPHIPVHLGSMGDSVRSVLERFAGDMAPGDSFLLNSPYAGGTHLPDITVVTPTFGADGALRYVVASRAHHADVGGTTPGSMPPMSTRIDEEGVLLDAVRIVTRGRFLEREVGQLFTSGPYPARNPRQNIADLKAQLAANARGSAALEKVVERFGLDVVHAYMRHVRENAAQCVRAAVARLKPGRFTVELDGGERIAVAVAVDTTSGTATIDFTGTSAESRNNANAPAAIVRAAVLYVFRTLVRERIPLNAGCLEPLTIVLPEPCLLNPRYPAAVVAGNVETSQAITDALLAALDACAAAQGTMNNFTFGNERHQYYETICGGAGAGPGFDGASAVHTHMTNSRLTDPEVLEWRYPVRVRRFEIRRGSGGAGAHRGGDGVVRDVEFLEPVHAAILSNRRRVAPFGLAGGGDGARGRNYVVRASGLVEELGGTAAVQLAAGDRFVIETPGGGGYGRRSDST